MASHRERMVTMSHRMKLQLASVTVLLVSAFAAPSAALAGGYHDGNCYTNDGLTLCYSDPGGQQYQWPGYGYDYNSNYNYYYQYPYGQYQYPYYQYQHQGWNGCPYGNCYWYPNPYQGGCSGSDCDAPEAGDPVSFVKWYFSAVWQTRDYDTLWNLQTPAFQKANSGGSFSDYTAWWDSVSYVTVHSASLVHKAGGTASVSVVLSFKLKNGKTISNQSYTYSLVYDDGLKSWKFQSG
jgi:hypothetical protein